MALQFLAQAFITAVPRGSLDRHGGQEGIISHVMVLEEMPADCRGWAIGVLNTGAACGGGLALLLFGASEGAWRLMYGLSILPLLGLGYVRRNLPETRRFVALEPETLGAAQEDASPSKCHVKQLGPVKRQHVAIVAATFLGSLFPSSANFHVSRHIQVHHGFGAKGFATLSLLGGLCSLSAFALAGYVGDRYGRRTLGALGICGKTAVDVAFYSASEASSAALLFCLRMALTMALDTNFQALSGEVFPTQRRSSAQARTDPDAWKVHLKVCRNQHGCLGRAS